MAKSHWPLAMSVMSSRWAYRLSFAFVFVIASLALIFLTYMLSIHTQNLMYGKTTSNRIKAMATKEFSKLHSAQVNKYLGKTQFQMKIDNLTVKDYARGAIRSGSDG